MCSSRMRADEKEPVSWTVTLIMLICLLALLACVVMGQELCDEKRVRFHRLRRRAPSPGGLESGLFGEPLINLKHT